MAATKAKRNVFKRPDRLNEFDRTPVSEHRLRGGGYFAGSFAGEHMAATEFVIGALFVTCGARAYDVFVGLLVGNLLAVLCWALICAPIAVQTRLTLYWYLRRIGGPAVMVVYNVLNAILYCILAGCMIAVAASAARIPFGIEPQTGWLPNNFWFVAVVICLGAVAVTLAILGFKRLAQFASICSPWMLLMFVAGALVMAHEIGGFGSWAGFWSMAETKIWTGVAPNSANQLGFWHIVSFAWICNLAMHLGLSDMAMLRYAKRSWYGLYSSFGMLLGHYVAWICAGIMGAAAALILQESLGNLDAGEVAFTALSWTGALAVVIAGWTASNPALYRAGLALQVVTPGWSRWLVTLLAGIAATAVACFPFVLHELLNFIVLYGLLLMPIGAIVVCEHWFFPMLGLKRYWSVRKGQVLNRPALLSWMTAVTAALVCWQFNLIHLFFLAVPIWVLTTVLYIVLARSAGAGEDLPELEEETTTPQPQVKMVMTGGRTTYVFGSALLAIACLLLILFFAWCVFAGYLVRPDFTAHLIWLSLVYFVAAVVWMNSRGRLVTVDASVDEILENLDESSAEEDAVTHAVEESDEDM